MKTSTIKRELQHFTGSEMIYHHPLLKGINYTEGIKFMKDACESHWLLIDLITNCLQLSEEHSFISIKLFKNENESSCYVSYDDGNGNLLKIQNYSFTDFPLYNEVQIQDENIEIVIPALHLYCVDKILLLTSEY